MRDFKKSMKNPFEKIHKVLSDLTTRGTARKGGFKGGKREKAQLKWGEEEYTVRDLRKKPIKDVRKEYSRLRSIARKRLERIKGSEFEKSQTYQKYKEGFKPLKELKSDREVLHETVRVAKYIQNTLSSFTQLKENKTMFLNTMNKRYPGIVDEANYWDFLEFMSAAGDAGLKDEFDSERLLMFFEEMEESGTPPDQSTLKEDFQKWQKDNEDKPFVRHQNAVPQPSSQIKRPFKRKL